MNWKCLLFFSVVFARAPAAAQERLEFYKGIRTQAMGGASIGVVDDQTALLLNPAGMAKLRDTYITLADPVGELNQNDDQMASGDANVLNIAPDPQKSLAAAAANPGMRLHAMGEVFPSIVFPNFGIGVLAHRQYDAEVDAAQKNYDYEYLADYALVAGFDFRLFDGIIKFGVNGRLIDRSQVSQPTLSPTATGLTLSGMMTEGVGLGTDAGLILTIPWDLLPSLAAVVRDIGGTAYNLRSGLVTNATTTPNSTPQTINGAFTITWIMANQVHSLWTVEYEDVLNAYQDTIPQRHYHGGVEFNFDDLFFIRGGYNQGYWTAGIELAVGFYELQFTSYGEEVGTSPSNLQQDRRYMAGLAIRF